MCKGLDESVWRTWRGFYRCMFAFVSDGVCVCVSMVVNK